MRRRVTLVCAAALLAACGSGGDPGALDRLESRAGELSRLLQAERVHYSVVHDAYDLLTASNMQADITLAFGSRSERLRRAAQALRGDFTEHLHPFRRQMPTAEFAQDNFIGDVRRSMTPEQLSTLQGAAAFFRELSEEARVTPPRVTDGQVSDWVRLLFWPTLLALLYVGHRRAPSLTRALWRPLRVFLPELLRREADLAQRVADEVVSRDAPSAIAALDLPAGGEVSAIRLAGEPLDCTFAPPDLDTSLRYVPGVHQVALHLLRDGSRSWRIALRAGRADDARAFAGSLARALADTADWCPALPPMLPVHLPALGGDLVERTRAAIEDVTSIRLTADQMDALLRRRRVFVVLGEGERTQELHAALDGDGVPTFLRAILVIGAAPEPRFTLDVEI